MTTLRKLETGPRAIVPALPFVLALVMPNLAIAEEPTLEEVKYHPAELPPDGTRGRLFLTGALLTVGWYGVSLGTSYLWSDAPNSSDLRLPVVGPWMALGDVGCGSRESTCSTFTVVLRTTLGVMSGVGQLGGLLALTEGVFLDTGTSSPAPSAPPRADAPHVGFGRTWTALPMALPDGGGLEIVGRF